MEISQERQQEMEKIIGEMKSSGPECHKDYECYKSSLEKLCNTKTVASNPDRMWRE